MRFRKLFNTLSNSAVLVLVAKHSHKGRPSLMVSWLGYWHNKNKTVSPSTSMALSTYKAKVLSLRHLAVKYLIWWDTASLISGIAMISFTDFSSSRHSAIWVIQSLLVSQLLCGSNQCSRIIYLVWCFRGFFISNLKTVFCF